MDSDGTYKTIDKIILQSDFSELARQQKELSDMNKAGLAEKVTYIQAGSLWFAALVISLFILLCTYLYGLVYHHKLYKNGTFYNAAIYADGEVNFRRDRDIEDNDSMDIHEIQVAKQALLRFAMPMSSCVLYLTSVILLSAHSLIRVLWCYKEKLEDRIVPLTIQTICSAYCTVALSAIIVLYKRHCDNVPQSHMVTLQKRDKLMMDWLKKNGAWSLHIVTMMLFFDDILSLTSVSSFDPNRKEGISLSNLLYIWLLMYTIYIIFFFVFDWKLNDCALILPYIIQMIILCEIPSRNYTAMSKDAPLFVSIAGIFGLICVTVRCISIVANTGYECIPHFKSE